MGSWYFQGTSIPEDRQKRVGKVFGHMTYTIRRNTFALRQQEFQAILRYTVLSETDSSITIRLRDVTSDTVLTLYRSGPNSLFIKAGSNLEHFKRIEA